MKDYLMPQTHPRKVRIFYSKGCVNGFKFYDSNTKLIFKIGETTSEINSKMFTMAAEEYIIGFKAKLHPASEAVYQQF